MKGFTYALYLQRCQNEGCDEPISHGDFYELDIQHSLIMNSLRRDKHVDDYVLEKLIDIQHVLLMYPFNKTQYTVSRFRLNK